MARVRAHRAEEAKEETTIRIAGFPFPLSPLFNPQSIKDALSFNPNSRDIILSSYPKCDSKYVDAILWKLLYPNSNLPQLDNLTNRYISCMEITGIKDQIIKQRPRLFKTYLPFHLIPFHRKVKYIYVFRSPWEACVSYYKLLNLIDGINVTFNEFFKDFLSGNVGYGSYFKHVSPWVKQADENNVLLLCHEQIKNNPRSALYLIAAFLGDHFLNLLLYHENLVDDIMRPLTWEKHKSLKPCSYKTFDKLEPIVRYYHLLRDDNTTNLKCTKKQIDSLLQKASEKFKNTNVEHLWVNLSKSYLTSSDSE